MTANRHDLWRPCSGCGPACLPLAGEVPAVPIARQVGRLAGVLGMLLAGAGMGAVLPVLPRPIRHAAGRAWARGLARSFGARLVVRGRLPPGAVLLVANHMSWLDVAALLAVTPARLVAKHEVRGWPLIGWLARIAGTVFVDRSRPHELPATVGAVAAVLRDGHPVGVFPEGTTWCGTASAATCRPGGGFRPAMFQAAVEARVPVVPVRISYRCAATGSDTTAPAFVGAENLWQSVRRVLATRDLAVSVSVGAALHPTPLTDRRRLARAAECAIGVRRGPLLSHSVVQGAPANAPFGFAGVGGGAVEVSGGLRRVA